MPKKSTKMRRGTSRSDDKHYFVHDDRVPRNTDTEMKQFSGSSRPRVSFKNQSLSRHEKRFFPKNVERIVKTSLDDDVMMSSTTNSNGRTGIFRDRRCGGLRGRNSPVSRGARPAFLMSRYKQGPVGDANWYKIIIPYGAKYDKEYLINTLSTHMETTFIPIMYKTSDKDVTFFVDEQKIANKLLQCDRKITTFDGFKIIVKVRPAFPQIDIDDALKQKMKMAMAKRYVPETNAIDLSRFHADPDLAPDYFCALFRPNTLMAVLDIVAENLPNLVALNLDNNKLHVIEKLSVLTTKFPNLKILYIGDNKIREMNQIDSIKDLKLDELRLAGNPLCNKYRTRQDNYVSDVRKRFPKLQRLDGTDLPPPILFDVSEDSVKLPPTKRIFSANPNAREIANQFLQQYFMVFDSESRQPLLNAYHEHACFSLSITPCPTMNKFSAYTADNRNLFRMNDVSRRRKLLKQGRLPVVSYISEMPKTQHYLNSFTMDIGLVTDAMMLITITGCFKEPDRTDNTIRYFHRTFIIVPEGAGYCIRNEQLHLSHPTAAQEKQLLNEAQKLPTPASEPSPSTSATVDPSDQVKQQMTLTLSQQTDMNLEWSLKCLKEVQWHYDNALAAFHEFFKRGQVPPEAFQK
ncbi:nuclear RNA export factor 1-like [Fopius arisanus]|uniref:Nuclear RNA export factor 1-like n=1 Tax=Fopius arisanus TaxID=64838 RepID=A0A9R1TY86_9HYME|nr:PREDICTED: nuclear RNA export factor 1-like [Fopius arisanus]